MVAPFFPHRVPPSWPRLAIAGVQLEESSTPEILRALDGLYAAHPDVPLLVLSEYTFAAPVPPEIRAWCAGHRRWLVAGGKQFLDPAQVRFRDTAFVVGPDGRDVFAQGKSQPIQFFDDGLPATGQAVWDSPWGKLGLCICYDLSYTRVTDALIRQGAQALIVPTMDVQAWGEREHRLHARVAPVRAAEYGVPVFRLASSGISQAVAHDGRVLAGAAFPGQGQSLAATLALPPGGGRLPVDRFLVWPCVSGAGLMLVWQLCRGGDRADGKIILSEARVLLSKPRVAPLVSRLREGGMVYSGGGRTSRRWAETVPRNDTWSSTPERSGPRRF